MSEEEREQAYYAQRALGAVKVCAHCHLSKWVAWFDGWGETVCRPCLNRTVVQRG